MIVGRRKWIRKCEFSNLPTVCVENVLDREIDLEGLIVGKRRIQGIIGASLC